MRNSIWRDEDGADVGVDEILAENLLILGNAGSGKTSACRSFARATSDLGWDVRYLNLSGHPDAPVTEIETSEPIVGAEFMAAAVADVAARQRLADPWTGSRNPQFAPTLVIVDGFSGALPRLWDDDEDTNEIVAARALIVRSAIAIAAADPKLNIRLVLTAQRTAGWGPSTGARHLTRELARLTLSPHRSTAMFQRADGSTRAFLIPVLEPVQSKPARW